MASFRTWKGLEHLGSLGRALLHHLGEGRAQVLRHVRELLRPLGPQLVEEVVERLLALALAHPHHARLEVVHHHGQVFVVAPVAQFVHADDVQLLQALCVQTLGHHALDNGAHSAPVDSHEPARGALVHALGQPRHHLLELAREVRVMGGPRHLLHSHAMLAALHPARGIAQPERRAPQGQVSPQPRRAGVVARAEATTDTAAGLAPGRPHLHHHAAGLEAGATHPQALHPQQPLQPLLHPDPRHRPPLPPRCPSRPCPYRVGALCKVVASAGSDGEVPLRIMSVVSRRGPPSVEGNPRVLQKSPFYLPESFRTARALA